MMDMYYRYFLECQVGNQHLDQLELPGLLVLQALMVLLALLVLQALMELLVLLVPKVHKV
jgi:hypothetical protein